MEAVKEGGLHFLHGDLVGLVGVGGATDQARPGADQVGEEANGEDSNGLPPTRGKLGGTMDAPAISFPDKTQAAILEGLDEVDAAALAQVSVEQAEDLVEDALAQPEAKAAVAGLPGGVACGEVVPGKAGGKFEEDAVEDTAIIDGRAAAQGAERGGEEVVDAEPLLVGEGLEVCGDLRLDEVVGF